MKLLRALEKAFEIKSMECRRETMLDYRSYLNNFKGYLTHVEQKDIVLLDFGKRNALEYLDYLLLEKQHQPITRNNNLRGMKVLFNVLKGREYVEENPFIGIKMLQVKQKRRKVFSKTESKIITNYLKQTDQELLLAVSLCYYCALRRTEMRRLKIENINLEKGLILLDGTQTKNKKLGSITLPPHFNKYLKEIRIDKYPAHYYVFSKNLLRGETPCATNAIPKRHREMLRSLHAQGLLYDIEGKSFYSWKDTAARDMIEAGVSAPTLQKHFRHSSLTTTQRYLESFGVKNEQISGWEKELF